MTEESDKTLIEKTIAGQDDAFQRLIQRHQDLVGQLVWRLIRAEQDREEVCQDVFLKVYFNLALYSDLSNRLVLPEETQVGHHTIR
jgi:DNA-directed RNA polymerase specialized sigma24 family protein